MASSSKKTIFQELKSHAWILGGLVVLLWGVQIVNAWLFNGQLTRYGIQPRQWSGLWGILLAPLLHGSFQHLMTNTIPLLTLGWLILLQETGDFLIVTVIAAIVSGLGTWITGAPWSVHIGASGVVFGYFGYLLLRGYFERSSVSILLSLLVVGLYGGMILGILPNQPGISWQGHLFGFVGGGVAARLLAKRQG